MIWCVACVSYRINQASLRRILYPEIWAKNKFQFIFNVIIYGVKLNHFQNTSWILLMIILRFDDIQLHLSKKYQLLITSSNSNKSHMRIPIIFNKYLHGGKLMPCSTVINVMLTYRWRIDRYLMNVFFSRLYASPFHFCQNITAILSLVAI